MQCLSFFLFLVVIQIITAMTQQEVLKKVEWKDLRHLTTQEMLIENNLTIPWFVISITLAYFEYYLLALPFSAFFLS